jgi:type 1 glutamine amidotransferase
LFLLAALLPPCGPAWLEGSTIRVFGDREASDRVLVFSRTAGFRHDAIPDAVAAIGTLGVEHGFAVDATEDPAVFDDAQLARYRAVVFLLTTGDVLDPGQRAAFERYIRAGNGYVGVHSASDTEYGWPWYGGLVGAYFQSHPAIQPAMIRIEDRGHPSTAGLPEAWERTDEWYSFRSNPRGEVHVLARLDEASYAGGTMGEDHPIAWYHDYDGGRAWYTAGGHTRESYGEPLFLQHLLGGIRYAAGLAPVASGDGSRLAAELSGPPSGALVLFDGSDTAHWQTKGGAAPIGWPIVDGALELCPGCGDVRTAETFQDFRLHVEFWLPASPEDAPEQERGNSGVYLQGRYELQVLDSFGRELSGANDGGAIYGLKDADLNASRPAETWQTYDVVFRAARWANGAKTEDARVTVRWNGSLVHDEVQIPAPTPGGEAESPEPGPILLQDHGQRVRYRSLWIESLP